MESNKKNKDSFINDVKWWITWWHTDTNQLTKQIQEYKTLKVFKSYKGIASLLILGSVVLTTIFRSYIALIYLPVAFFVYKGKKLAIILMMIAWTLDKSYQLIFTELNTTQFLFVILWWSIFMKYLYGAYKVEKLRSKQQGLLTGKNGLTLSKDKKKSKIPLVLAASALLLFFVGFTAYWYGVSSERQNKEESQAEADTILVQSGNSDDNQEQQNYEIFPESNSEKNTDTVLEIEKCKIASQDIDYVAITNEHNLLISQIKESGRQISLNDAGKIFNSIKEEHINTKYKDCLNTIQF